MSMAKQAAVPVFFAPFIAKGEPTELALGADSTSTVLLNISGNYILVQARSADIYYQFGAPATTNSFVMVADRDPILMPLPRDANIRFLGTQGAVLVIQPVDVVQ